MLKTVNFENVNFNEKFSYKGRTYKKVVCANDKPGAFNLFDETVCTSCQDWDCLVDRKEENAIESPKERKKYILRDTYNDENFGVSLTQDQIKLLFWLDNRSFLHEDVTFNEAENLEFTEI